MRLALRHPALAGLAVFTAIVAVARLATLRAPIANDTGQYLYVGQVLLDGGTPYVDAANNKGPLTYVLFALLGLVGGAHPVFYRVVLIVFAGLAALAVAGYAAHYGGRAAGVLAGVTLALLSGTAALQGDDPNTEQFGVAPMAGAWYLATRGTARTAAAAGALASAAVLMNIAFAVVLPFVAWELWRAAPAGRRARPLLIAVAAGVAVALPFAVWLLAAGALDDFAAQVLGRAGRAATGSGSALSGSGLEAGEGAVRLTGVRFLLDVRAGGLWVAGLLGCAIAARDARARPGAVAAALWIVVAWLRVKLPSYELPHQSYPALPAIAVGLALGVAALWQPATGRRVALAALVLVLAAWPNVVSPQWEAAWDPPWERPAQSYPLAEQYPVARFVGAHTAPSDRIIVSGSWSQLYWLADRRAPTRFFDHEVSNLDAGDAAARRRDLFAHPPRAIVQLPPEPLEPDLEALLRRTPYRLAYDSRGARVWLRS